MDAAQARLLVRATPLGLNVQLCSLTSLSGISLATWPRKQASHQQWCLMLNLADAPPSLEGELSSSLSHQACLLSPPTRCALLGGGGHIWQHARPVHQHEGIFDVTPVLTDS